jgi:hypothetical protein
MLNGHIIHSTWKQNYAATLLWSTLKILHNKMHQHKFVKLAPVLCS